LAGVTFGVNYDSTAIFILAAGSCADFEISTGAWPAPNSGTALTWSEPRTSHLTEVYWFAGYTYDGATQATFALQSHPTQGGSFADDSVPAALDDISGFGVLGFGMPGSIPGCGAGAWESGMEGWTGDGGLEGGGGDDAPAPEAPTAAKAIKRDTNGNVVIRSVDAAPSPGIVTFGVRRDEIATVLPGGRSVEASEFNSVDLQAALEEFSPIDVARTFPTFDLADTSFVRPDGTMARIPDLTRIFTVTFDPAVPPDSVAARLRGCTSVLWADLHWPPIPCSTPNDEKFTQGLQWSLERVGFGPTADAAWAKLMRPAPSWRIGVLDGGFDVSHVDLGNGYGSGKKIRSALNYFPGRPIDSCAAPGVRHGTNSAGVAAALTNNQQVGVASIGGGFNPTYMGPELVLLATWCDGRDDFPAAVVDASAASLPDGQPANCRIISYSGGNYVWNEAERLACFTAYQRGSLLCAAKGNGGESDQFFPADYDQHWIMSVGASDRDHDWRAPSEDFGWGSNYGYGIDLVAPGVAIPTTDPGQGYRDNYSATSAATPLVAAAASALQLNADFTLAPEDLQGLLRGGCYDVLHDRRHLEQTLYGPDEFTGAGRLDVAASLALLDPPYVFMRLESDPSQNTWEAWSWRWVTFIEGARPLPFPEGTWMAFPFEVTAHVAYPTSFLDPPHAWVVGSRSNGVSLNSPNYGDGAGYFGSTTETGCTVYGITYLVVAPGFTGYWPINPALLTVGVSATGEIAVTGASEGRRSRPSVPWRVEGGLGRDVRFVFPDGVAQGLRLDLYSAAGRRVRELTPPIAGSEYRLVWDGRDDLGRRCPSGIYWGKVRGGSGNDQIARVILVR